MISNIETPDWHIRRRQRPMTEEEWTAHQRDLFWNGVEDMLLAITSAITLLALIALIIIQVMEWMS